MLDGLRGEVSVADREVLLSTKNGPNSALGNNQVWEHSQFKGNADQLGMEVIGMLWEAGVERFC